MSTTKNIRKDFGSLRDEWKELDPRIRFVDLITLLNIVIFGIAYILVNVIKISLTVTNATMMIFPIIMSGYLYVYRSNLLDENKDNSDARKEFINFVTLCLFLVGLTIVYSLFLNTVVD